MAEHTQNIKILVNFNERKIIHSKEHAGSIPIKDLVSKGFEIVGTIKPDLKIYWKPDFFDFKDKYPKTNISIEQCERL